MLHHGTTKPGFARTRMYTTLSEAEYGSLAAAIMNG